jgi:hypothetical protein
MAARFQPGEEDPGFGQTTGRDLTNINDPGGRIIRNSSSGHFFNRPNSFFLLPNG